MILQIKGDHDHNIKRRLLLIAQDCSTGELYMRRKSEGLKTTEKYWSSSKEIKILVCPLCDDLGSGSLDLS